jgi:ATP-dependent 26S proteasome regulatory subunit
MFFPHFDFVFPHSHCPKNHFFSVRMLREELQLLQEPGSYVGEVIKVMGKTKILVKVCVRTITVLLTTMSQSHKCWSTQRE